MLRPAFLRFALVVVWSATWLGACGGGRNAVVERLDEQSGVLLTSGRELLVFARTEPRYSRSARDYLYLGPAETNRQGVREYFLWVGVATTLDRGFVAPPADLPLTLYVTVAGEPMELALTPWATLVRADVGGPVFETAVPVRAELGARVTLQQLALFSAEALDSIAVSSGERSSARRYGRWGEPATFDDFLRPAGVRPAR